MASIDGGYMFGSLFVDYVKVAHRYVIWVCSGIYYTYGGARVLYTYGAINLTLSCLCVVSVFWLTIGDCTGHGH